MRHSYASGHLKHFQRNAAPQCLRARTWIHAVVPLHMVMVEGATASHTDKSMERLADLMTQ